MHIVVVVVVVGHMYVLLYSHIHSVVHACADILLLCCNHVNRQRTRYRRYHKLATTMAVHGSLAPFNPEEEDWVEYTDRLSYYFTANGITDNAKKRAILISCCGPATFRLMKTLAFPDQLNDFTFAQLVEKV